EMIILAVKPKDLKNVSETCAALFSKDQLLVSVLAGTSLSQLREHFTIPKLLRIMPNLAITQKEGIIGLVENEYFSKEWKEKIQVLFQGLGMLYWLAENKIDALSALTASGPAFILLFIESMIEGGISLGFTSKESRELVLKTIEGTLALIGEGSQHPGEIKWQITSPGGMTIAGLKEMEQMAVRSAVMKALLAAYAKAQHMHHELS
ncbi:MAG: pyrroline-5-carboxylate reductase, partial [Anaerolineae bacterium]